MKQSYHVVTFSPVDAEIAEMIAALCFEAGADGISENTDEITASFKEDPKKNENWQMLEHICKTHRVDFQIKKQDWKNWNEEWEKNFKPVEIANQVHIRALFHPEVKDKLNIIIDPEMAFGTGHHPTTAMVMELMLKVDFTQKKVLDFGCGSGILSVLAHKLGAQHILAVDYDAVATETACRNFELNRTPGIQLLTGEKEVIPAQKFDVILANINKNVIVSASAFLSELLERGGLLIVSGILVSDEKEVEKALSIAGFSLKHKKSSDEWLAMTLLLD